VHEPKRAAMTKELKQRYGPGNEKLDTFAFRKN